jgi:hypothetical protein
MAKQKQTNLVRSSIPLGATQFEAESTGVSKSRDYRTEMKSSFKPIKSTTEDDLLTAGDIATDVMQFGNFIPHPAAQAVGKVGNIVGGAIDTYQGMKSASKGNYKSAAANFASAALPSIIKGASVAHQSKKLVPRLGFALAAETMYDAGINKNTKKKK